MINKEELKRRIQSQQKIKELASSNKKLDMPTAPQLVKNLGNSVVNNIKSVMAGNSLNISDEEKEKRLSICKGCEFFSQVDDRCSRCGCYLKVKTYLKAERCPIGKW